MRDKEAEGALRSYVGTHRSVFLLFILSSQQSYAEPGTVLGSRVTTTREFKAPI